jgi:hypothetical protein
MVLGMVFLVWGLQSGHWYIRLWYNGVITGFKY